jgi:hypothetical protein
VVEGFGKFGLLDFIGHLLGLLEGFKVLGLWLDKGLFIFFHSHGFFVEVVADLKSFQVSGGVHAFPFVVEGTQLAIFVIGTMDRKFFVLWLFAGAMMLANSFGVGQ